MPNRADIAWFKACFAQRINAAIAGTPFSLDFMVALACQETGEVWTVLRRDRLGEDNILALCVGDSIDGRADGGGRSAFPRNKAELMAAPDGAAMFVIARKALVDMAARVESYRGAAAKPDKFCRGFGMFQRDLQFYKQDAPYFLQQRYARFDATLDHALRELKHKQGRIGFGGREELSVLEMVAVAIAYNTGRYDPRRGLKQGYKPPNGKYYGEALFDFLRLAETVGVADAPALIDLARPGQAIVPPPSPVTATGPFMRVDTRVSTLLLRREPRKSQPRRESVVGELPDGHLVRALTGRAINGFMAVETSLAGALLRGFASMSYLKPAPGETAIEIAPPAITSGVRAARLPRKRGRLTRRADPADAHSLNEVGQPGRKGADVDALRAELGDIIAWLDVEKKSHKRYQPRAKQTFCNIYCHDYCHLAGVYLPRVWWSAPALMALGRGEDVAPLIGDTVNELRANDLFRWLRDFGHGFGWRQTGTLTKLQLAANQGAVAVIIARRKDADRSGHIVMVVPETETHMAKRDSNGEVTAPLQSQSGVTNFRYGNSQPGWWNKELFAENAFWIHA